MSDERALKKIPRKAWFAGGALVLACSGMAGAACGDSGTSSGGGAGGGGIAGGAGGGGGGVPSDGSAPGDAGADADVGPQDAGAEASCSDAGPPSDGATTYHDMASPCFWSTYAATTGSLLGGAFDGRYVYLSAGGGIGRYDSQADFGSSSSWSLFDPVVIDDAGANRFSGAVFDGRYIYFVPNADNPRAARYDTQGSFTDVSSWSLFDTAGDAGTVQDYYGATFDGRFIYFAPYANATTYDGLALRYDTQGSFGSASSWTTFDTTTVNSGARGFWGAVFDGRYVYFVPQCSSLDALGYPIPDGLVTRFDTQASFTAPSSWSTFDTSTVDPYAKGFAAAAFDGRFIYFMPLAGPVDVNPPPPPVLARYDTQASFATASSWSTFEFQGFYLARPLFYMGAQFDGRYAYFFEAPSGAGYTSGSVTRYDSEGSFADAASWLNVPLGPTLGTEQQPANVGPFQGSAFDGRYIYFAGDPIARFDAKTPASMPILYGDGGPTFYGSFF